MKDAHGRTLNYLRISVTDRCNLRCVYCMPEEGIHTIPHEEILTFDEIERVVRILAREGIDRLRLTGGEPLVRRNLPQLAQQLKQVAGIRFLGITTNGVLLEKMAEPLLKAGVDGINLSLDTTDSARYAEMVRRDELPKVWRGLQAALSLPFKSVRVNCVLSPDNRAEDWLGVVALAKEYPLDVRLIEWMPMAKEEGQNGLSGGEALQIIEEHFGPLTEVENPDKAGPAKYWAAKGFKGRIGLIPSMSQHFCASCNRLRLTAEGYLKLCLFYDRGLSIKKLLRGGASDEEIARAIEQAVQQKPKNHLGRVVDDEGPEDNTDRPCGMYRIGG